MPESYRKGVGRDTKQLADLRVRRSLFYRCGEPSQVSFCKSCRLLHHEPHITANFAGSHCMMTIQGAVTALFADTVLFDLVLKGTKADSEQFGRLLAMVCDFGEGPPDRFTFDFL